MGGIYNILNYMTHHTLFIAAISILVLVSCGNSSRKSQPEVDSVTVVEPVQEPLFDADTVTPPDLQRHETKETETPAPAVSTSPASPTISRYYEEGYDNGYDDGEEDAIGDNGWRGDYDESSQYRGWKRKEYEDGYDDGYEAGYDDNFEGAEE